MKNHAFTLLEFLLYAGIVAITLIVATAIAVNILLGKAKSTVIEEVNQNARFALEKITQTIRNSQAINSPTIGASSSTLSLQTNVTSTNPTIFDLLNNTLRLKESTGAAASTTSDEVKVTTLTFTNISATTTAPGTVRIIMTIEADNAGNLQEYTYSETFYATANIRKK